MKRAAIAIFAVASIAGTATAQAPAGAYTTAQADRGDQLSGPQCAECHAADFSGTAGAPSLRGPGFKANWNGKTVEELYKYIREGMPPGQPGSLTEPQYADTVAAILRVNKQPAGEADLAPGGPGMKAVIAIP
jgi:mono/diheme cytochrome c family protein